MRGGPGGCKRALDGRDGLFIKLSLIPPHGQRMGREDG
jgi:hypothetical protein